MSWVDVVRCPLRVLFFRTALCRELFILCPYDLEMQERSKYNEIFCIVIFLVKSFHFCGPWEKEMLCYMDPASIGFHIHR
jgi:hypothetical protein